MASLRSQCDYLMSPAPGKIWKAMQHDEEGGIGRASFQAVKARILQSMELQVQMERDAFAQDWVFRHGKFFAAGR